MNLIKRLTAGLLYIVVISILVIGAFLVPGRMYIQSPWWFLEEVNPDEPGSFFVAFMSEDSGVIGKQLHVIPVGIDPQKEGYSGVQYYMPEESLYYSWGAGEGSASIYVKQEAQGNQIIQVFVVGDTPWTSLSEYRVVGNKIYPLRHAHSVAWFLLGIIFCLSIVRRLSTPIKRGIKQFMRIELE